MSILAHHWATQIIQGYAGATGGIVNPGGQFIHTPWPLDVFTKPIASVKNGGATYYIRPGIFSQGDWNTALSQMNSTGGNVIVFMNGQHNGEYRVRGSNIAGGTAKAGLPFFHNQITCEPNAVITGTKQGQDALPAIAIAACDHWDVLNCNIDGSDLFGIQYTASRGTVNSPCLVACNTVMNTEHAHIVVQGWWQTPYLGSDYVKVFGNIIDGGTNTWSIPEFREGIYCGQGAAPWEDTTSNITIALNVISRITSDTIELKPGVDHVLIEDNLFLYGSLAAGNNNTSIPTSHITVCYANGAQPGGDTELDVIVRRNRAFEMRQASGVTRPVLGLGRGGAQAYSNLFAGYDHSHPVEIISGSGFYGTGTIVVAHNSATGALLNNPSGYASVTTENNVPDQYAASMHGPLTDTCDAGEGPGSGMALSTMIGSATTGTHYNDCTDHPPNDPADPGALAALGGSQTQSVDIGLATETATVLNITGSVDSGYNPANFDKNDYPIRTDFPDPYEDKSTQHRTRSAVVPQVFIKTGLFTHPTRNTALTTSNNDAGVLYTDPLVYPGQTGGPVATMMEGHGKPHEHTYLGNRLGPNANMLDMANEPTDHDVGSNAVDKGFGWRALITNTETGEKFGYSPGVWWPRIYFDGSPVEHISGIATYYVRRTWHIGERCFLLPNGAGFIISRPESLSLNQPASGAADYRISVHGPSWFHKDIHLGAFPNGDGDYNEQFVSYEQTKPGPDWCATPQFQTYIKMRVPPTAPDWDTLTAEGGYQSPRFHYGNPTDIGIQFHCDYVAGWTDQQFAQELIDRTANRNINTISQNIKFEGWKPSWNTDTNATTGEYIPPAPTDLGL